MAPIADTEAEAEQAPPRRRSRLGSVAGALLWEGCSRPRATTDLLAGLFEEVLLVGGGPPSGIPGRRLPGPVGSDPGLPALAAALAATEAERVAYVPTDGPLLTADLLLALTAWPEADVVVVGDGADDAPALPAIYRRGVCLGAARARIAEGRRTQHDLLESVETTRVSLAQLGIAEADGPPLTHAPVSDDPVRLEGR